MRRFDSLAAFVLTAALCLSFVLFGIWEDKLILFGPLLSILYIVLSAWMCGGIKRTPPGGIPLLLFWFYNAAMIPFVELPYEAKISTLRFGCYVTVYWASANLFSRFAWRKTVLGALFIVLALTALYSLVQHSVAPNLLFGMERYTGYWKNGRLGGTYQCPNHIAHLYQMWLPFCLLFVFIPRLGWFWRICFAYGLGLFGILIYQTQSRAGLLGAAAGLGATIFFLLLRRGRRAFFIALLVAPLLIAGAVGGLWAGSEMFRTRMMPVVKFLEHHTQSDLIEEEFRDFRPQTWLDTLDMIRARPITGFGPGSYELIFEKFRTRVTATGMITVHAHNEYLEFAAEYGLVGLVLLLAVLGAAGIPLVRTACRSAEPHHALPAIALLGALAGTAVHGFFDFELRIFPNALMLALLSGCAVAPILRTVDDSKPRPVPLDAPPEPPPRRRTDAVVHWIAVPAFCLAAIWSLQVVSSGWIRAAGDHAFEADRFSRAGRLYQRAIAIDPQNWRAHLGRAQLYHLSGYYDLNPASKKEWMQKKKEALETAWRINPIKEEVAYGLATAELFFGNQERGLDLLRDVAVYKRFNDFYWRRLGIELRRAGLYEEALAAFEHAHKLNRSNQTVRRNIQWLKTRIAQEQLESVQ